MAVSWPSFNLGFSAAGVAAVIYKKQGLIRQGATRISKQAGNVGTAVGIFFPGFAKTKRYIASLFKQAWQCKVEGYCLTWLLLCRLFWLGGLLAGRLLVCGPDGAEGWPHRWHPAKNNSNHTLWLSWGILNWEWCCKRCVKLTSGWQGGQGWPGHDVWACCIARWCAGGSS